MHDIKVHIKHNSCGLALDPWHVLNIPTFHDDMILAKSHESHVIVTSLFRLSR